MRCCEHPSYFDIKIIVNTARGAIIDERALIAELQKGRLFAALDVLEQESVSEENPLRLLPNTILTPHIGGLTFDCRKQMVEMALEEVLRFAKGEPLHNLIDIHQYDRATDMEIGRAR
jgi:phosphoglycerate dehydrogenase-like enzyme